MESSLHLVPGRYKLPTAPGRSLRKDSPGWEKAENKFTATSGLPAGVCVSCVHKNPNSTLSYQSLTKMDGSLHLVPGRLKAVLEEGQSGMGKCRSQNHGDLRPTCVCVCVCVCE